MDTFFEDDIRLTVFQAEQLLQDLSRRPKRKLAEPLSKRWPLPILYSFDGSHSKSLILHICSLWTDPFLIVRFFIDTGSKTTNSYRDGRVEKVKV